MKNKSSVRFTKADIGTAVVFAGFDGGSYSATITDVRLDKPNSVRVAYYPCGTEPVFATITSPDFHRLTKFGASKFLVLETL